MASHLVVCPGGFLNAYQCSSAVAPQAKHSFPKGTSSHIQSTESGDSGLALDSRPCISDDHKSSMAAAQWTENPTSTSNLFSSWRFLLILSKDGKKTPDLRQAQFGGKWHWKDKFALARWNLEQGSSAQLLYNLHSSLCSFMQRSLIQQINTCRVL